MKEQNYPEGVMTTASGYTLPYNKKPSNHLVRDMWSRLVPSICYLVRFSPRAEARVVNMSNEAVLYHDSQFTQKNETKRRFVLPFYFINSHVWIEAPARTSNASVIMMTNWRQDRIGRWRVILCHIQLTTHCTWCMWVECICTDYKADVILTWVGAERWEIAGKPAKYV